MKKEEMERLEYNVSKKESLSLRYEAERLLGSETLNNLLAWREKIVSARSRYTVFMARRSYVLFLLLEKISKCPMEEEFRKNVFNGLKDKEPNRSFVTDSGMLLQCAKLYEYYEQHGKRFPKIEIVDDVLIHGRNINNLLLIMEKQLLMFFEEKHKHAENNSKEQYEAEYRAVRNAFVEAVTIRVFYCSRGSILLSPRFLLCLQYKARVEISVLRQFSNELSTLVLFADVANATYIISEKITVEQIEMIQKKAECVAREKRETAFLKSTFQNNTQYLLIKYFKGKEDAIAAIGIVRLLYHAQNDSYRAIPLVILPELDKAETERLISLISEYYATERINDWLKILSKIDGKRMLNEFLTLVLSNALLLEFNAEFGIKRDEDDFSDEIHKLARNYYYISLEESELRLKGFLQKAFISKEGLEKIINTVTNNKLGLISIGKEGEVLTQQKMTEIRKQIEKRFYDLGRRDELQAMECEKKTVFDTRDIFEFSHVFEPKSEESAFSRKKNDCYSLLGSLLERRNCEDQNYMLALFFQMMDAGILGFSSFASMDDEVDGLRQYVKAGEQAMFLYPIEMYLYVPMLCMIEQRAKLRGIKFQDELKEFLASKECIIEEYEKTRIKEYAAAINEMGQNMDEWNGNYYRKLDLPDEESGIQDIRGYFDRQIEYMKAYQSFCYE